MKKIVLLMAMACAVTAVSAQEAEEGKYLRPSLYTIMVSTDKLTGSDAEKLVTDAFDRIPIPAKYDDINLSSRHLDLLKIEVTKEEIESATQKKKGLGGLVKKGKDLMRKNTSQSEVGKMTDDEKIARIKKFLKDNHVANKLIAKWYNESDKMVNGSHFNYDRIIDKALYSASKEERIEAKKKLHGEDNIWTGASLDLISKTFVMVTAYRYISYDELAAEIKGGAEIAKQIGFSGIGSLAELGGDVFGGVSDGYFITAESYLFQLDWDENKRDMFEKTYWPKVDTKEFYDSDEFSMKFVKMAKSKVYAGKAFAKSTDERAKKLIYLATQRATDKSIAKLASDYDDFKTLSQLHFSEDGQFAYAYIGTKEDVKAGDKFHIVQLKTRKDGRMEKSFVKTLGINEVLTVAEGKVWDNLREEGYDEELEVPGENKDVDKTAKYTVFNEKPKEAWVNSMGGFWLEQSTTKREKRK